MSTRLKAGGTAHHVGARHGDPGVVPRRPRACSPAPRSHPTMACAASSTASRSRSSRSRVRGSKIAKGTYRIELASDGEALLLRSNGTTAARGVATIDWIVGPGTGYCEFDDHDDDAALPHLRLRHFRGSRRRVVGHHVLRDLEPVQLTASPPAAAPSRRRRASGSPADRRRRRRRWRCPRVRRVRHRHESATAVRRSPGFASRHAERLLHPVLTQQRHLERRQEDELAHHAVAAATAAPRRRSRAGPRSARGAPGSGARAPRGR